MDHQQFAELYGKKQMSELSPRMFKLMQELMEYPFFMRYMPVRGSLIGMVDALSRAPHEDASTLCSDPLDLQYHSIKRDQGQTSHKSRFAAQALNKSLCIRDITVKLNFFWLTALGRAKYSSGCA